MFKICIYLEDHGFYFVPEILIVGLKVCLDFYLDCMDFCLFLSSVSVLSSLYIKSIHKSNINNTIAECYTSMSRTQFVSFPLFDSFHIYFKLLAHWRGSYKGCLWSNFGSCLLFWCENYLLNNKKKKQKILVWNFSNGKVRKLKVLTSIAKESTPLKVALVLRQCQILVCVCFSFGK